MTDPTTRVDAAGIHWRVERNPTTGDVIETRLTPLPSRSQLQTPPIRTRRYRSDPDPDLSGFPQDHLSTLASPAVDCLKVLMTKRPASPNEATELLRSWRGWVSVRNRRSAIQLFSTHYLRNYEQSQEDY